MEINADHRMKAHVSFDPDDLDAAFEELDARYLAGEAAAHAHTWSVIAQGYTAANRNEILKTTPDFVNIDDRQFPTIEPGNLIAYLRDTFDDLTDIYYRALTDDTLAGPVNATAPHPVRNADYARTLAQVLHRPLQLPVPGIAPRFLLGAEGSRELAQADQRVIPGRLLRDDHRFRHPDLESALRHLLGRTEPDHEGPAAVVP